MSSRIDRHRRMYSFLLAMAPSWLCPPISYPSALRAEDFQGTERYTFIQHDMNRDSRPDYVQRLDRRQGWKDAFYLDMDLDGRFEESVTLEDLKADDVPHIVIAVDGFPYGEMMRLRGEGHFLLFRNVGRMVAPYPSLSGPGWSKIMGLDKPEGYERRYFNKKENRIEGGSNSYGLTQDNNMIDKLEHARAYVQVRQQSKKELEDRLASALERRDCKHMLLYVLSTDAAGHRLDEQDFLDLLKSVDQMVERIFYDYRCRCRITLVSDHGNNRKPGTFVNITKALEDAGFHRNNSIDSDKDFAVPLYGMVGVAAIYTHPDNARNMASVLTSLAGVRFCSWPDSEGVHIVSKGGEAVVTWRKHLLRYDIWGIFSRLVNRGDDYLYQPLSGDPLGLKALIASSAGLNLNRYCPEGTWFEETWDHVCPDPLRRLRHAFDDNVKNNATLLADMEDGYYSAGLVHYVARSEGTHGSLSAGSSTGIIAASWCEVPQAIRADEVNANFRLAAEK